MGNIAVDITFHPSWWHKNAGTNFGEEFFFEPEYRIQSDIRMRKLLFEKFGDLGFGEKNPRPRPILGTDLLASGFLYSGIMGCPIKYYQDNPPEVVCARLNKEEIYRLKELDLTKVDLWQSFVAQVEYLEQKYGFVESHINLQGILNIALDLRSSDLFLDYFEEPDLALELLNECTRISLEIGRYLSTKSRVLSHGVTGITAKVMPDVYLTSNCTVEMISQATYEGFLLEFDQKLADTFQPFGIHHCGKTMEHVVEGYAKVKGLQFAEVGAGSNIKMIRQILPEVFLNLRYSPVNLKNASEDEMRREISAMAESADERFSISCVGIDAMTDDRQIRSFIQSVQALK
jgi:hypothetical protein